MYLCPQKTSSENENAENANTQAVFLFSFLTPTTCAKIDKKLHTTKEKIIKLLTTFEEKNFII